MSIKTYVKECQRAVKVSSFSWVGKTSLGWQQRKAFSRCFANKWDANRTFRNIDMICIFHLTNLPLSLTWTWHAKRKWKQIYSWRCALCTENLKYILGIWLCFTYAACPYARGHPGAKTTKHRKLKATNENNKLGSTKKNNQRTNGKRRPINTPSNKPNCKFQWQLSAATYNHKFPSPAGLSWSVLCTGLKLQPTNL